MSAKRQIWRIWSWNQNDRREIARVATKNGEEDFDRVQSFILNTFIVKKHRKDVDLIDNGIEWHENTPETCLESINDCEKCRYRLTSLDNDDICTLDGGNLCETVDKAKTCQFELNGAYSPCEFCGGCLAGLQIEFVGEEGSDWHNKPEFRTIFGTNEFYDLSGKTPKKAADWRKELSKAWKRSPEHGIAALIVYATPKEAVSPKLLRESEEKLKGA